MTTLAHRTFAFLTVAAVLSSVNAAPGVSHAYNLADFTGTIPFNHVSLSMDRPRGEVYVLDANSVHVFNASGMEVYRFDIDPARGSIVSIALEPEGDILAVGYANDGSGVWSLQRYSYRGEPLRSVVVSGLPPAFEEIQPGALFIAQDSLYLVSKTQMLVVVVDRSGAFVRGLDLGALIEVPKSDRVNVQISGFDVEESGAMLFTVPVHFRAYVVSSTGAVASFGKVGSAPGQFGVVAGIARDGSHYLVADKLRSVVMVFDDGFRFVTEFGFLGLGLENLVRPDQLAVGDAGKIYVTQLYNRGVAVFSLAFDGARDR